MTKNYHDPIDAIRDLLSEEYEATGEEIKEDEDELDWNREIWVKGGGGTWKAKQIRDKVKETAKKIISLAKEDRFSPSLAYNLYAYSDTLNDFVNGKLDSPEDAFESFEGDKQELTEFVFGKKKLPVGRKQKKLDDLGDALFKAFKESGMAPTKAMDNLQDKYSFSYTKGDAEDASEIILHITNVAESPRKGDLVRSWRYPTSSEDTGYVVKLWWRHGKVVVSEYDHS